MELKKNKEYIVRIIDNGYEGEGIAKIENKTIFVPNGIEGEKVRIKILKNLKSHAYAKIIEIMESSDKRVEPECESNSKCGGCNLRHIEYDETLNIKKKIVENCFRKEIEKNIEIEKTIGMGFPYYYRNKLQYPVGIDNNGNTVMGIYSARTHNIVATTECLIQNRKAQEIANTVYKFIIDNKIPGYDEEKGTGIVRHVIVRIGIYSNEIMVILVTKQEKLPKEKEFVQYLKQKHPEIRTIIKNINNENTNVILGEREEILYGDGYIKDTLGRYEFKISTKSFYQINPVQTEILYNIAIEYANLTGKETVFDLYCGIGTIGIFASEFAKHVYGIEVVKEAVKDAIENAKINKINNIEFYTGEVENILQELIEKKEIEPDIVFLDPPRKGSDEKTIQTLLNVKPKKIVYISCNPATLVRDIRMLEEKYEVKKVQPIDMFPYTKHVECVSVLELKKTIEK